MLEDIFRPVLYVIFRVKSNRKPSLIAPKEISNSYPHCVARCFFFAPLIDSEFLCLQFFQQANGDSLNSLDVGCAEILLFQQIEYGQ